jgi:hypothetical protein
VLNVPEFGAQVSRGSNKKHVLLTSETMYKIPIVRYVRVLQLAKDLSLGDALPQLHDKPAGGLSLRCAEVRG